MPRGIYKRKPEAIEKYRLNGKLRGFQKGNKIGVGRKHTEEWKKRMSKYGKVHPNSGWFKKGQKPSKNRRIYKGDENHAWRGGISFEPYSLDWTDDLKESIRRRDNYVCQLCGTHQDELGGYFKKLDIHHIDYDKHNLNPNNLIALCRSCHAKTNFDRDYWIKHFYETSSPLRSSR